MSNSDFGTSVEVVPTVTAGAYSSGTVIGGIIPFPNVLPFDFNGTLKSLTLKFKGTVQTVEFDVALFTSSPAGTYADNGAPTFTAADAALLLGVYKMTANVSSLGTMTVYNLDNIQKKINGASTSLYAVVTAKSAPVNPASTSDMSLQLGVAWESGVA